MDQQTETLVLTEIEAGRIGRQYWKDLWRYRELFFFLAWRDIAVRYKQTAIGVVWSVLRPLAPMVVFTLVFGKLAQLPSHGAPYALLVFAGLLPWQFFSAALQESSNSLINNSAMISKVYFPRLVVPVSAVFVSLVDLLIAFAALLPFLWWYRVIPEWKFLALPIFVFFAFGIALGAGLWFAALNVEYRDFRYIVSFVVQFGLFVSPVGFSSAIVPERWRLLYAVNPVVGVIEGFRWAILPGQSINWLTQASSVLWAAVLLMSGIWYFRRMERHFADVI